MSNWGRSLGDCVERVEELVGVLGLDHVDAGLLARACEGFKLRVPREFVERMRVGDVRDPLLLQVLPQVEELQTRVGYVCDPLEEKHFNPVPGLLHKYPSRVLLTLTGACAINCRYCFRRNFPYEANRPDKKSWQRILEYIQKDSRINEIIFSGGDPLILKDHTLNQLAQSLAEISHLKTLRLHTRLPIVIPQRVDDALMTWLTALPLKTVVVTHANHPNEIDEEVIERLQALRAVQVTVLNQSVLLRGINDNVSALKHLSERLFEAGVLPYYLHLLDKVAGAGHFEVPASEALSLMQALSQQLPGYLVPKLVREVPGELAKQVVSG